MLFNSFEFLLFFLVVFALYYSALFRGKQVGLLIFASFAFYAWGATSLTLLLLCSICMNSATSLLVFRATNRKIALFLAFAGVVCNVLLLFLFKYAPMLTQSFQQLFHTYNSFTAVLLHVPLPIGISFYTFEGISLLVDTYKGVVRPGSTREHVRRTALFMSFFPHLIAGPILRAREFYPQIKEKRFGQIQWERVIHFLILGFFFKMFVADNLTLVTKWLMNQNFQPSSTIGGITSLIAFSFQIFADFAGYSFIAVGLGLLLGYELPVNFRAPYIARSLREFWQHWHITLSNWIRDYLYIPLGGNRGTVLKVCFNLLVVMTLAGLWHGAEWGFALWGFYHGVGLCLERLLMKTRTLPPCWTVWSPMQALLIFAFVTCGWLVFKMPRLNDSFGFARSLIEGINYPVEIDRIMLTIAYGLPVVLYHILKCPSLTRNSSATPVPVMEEVVLKKIGPKRGPIVKGIVYGIMLSLTILNAGEQDEFIYFQF